MYVININPSSLLTGESCDDEGPYKGRRKSASGECSSKANYSCFLDGR